MNIKLLRNTLAFLLLLSVNIFSMQLYAQQRDAITVSVNINPPFSVYLSDYISPGSNKLMVTLVFNDFNEPTQDVYLKLKVESNNFRIVSRGDFIPSHPISITPGVPVQLSGDQLATYFDLNNVEVSGMSKAELSISGKLIEGNYTFCFEVYDYKKPSSKPISSACAIANLKLNDPPRLVLPEDQAVIPLTSPNINFQWQLPSGDPTSKKFILSLYELPDYKISPTVAVQNNQAVKIFESSQLDNPFFIYDMNSPLLKRGVKYAWRVQAVNTNKRDEFKNKGFSLVRSFSYGYPENGKVGLKAPVDGHAFSLRESKTFRWTAPDNLTPNQSYFYRIKIVKVGSMQSDTTALSKNIPVYTNQSQILNPSNPDYEVSVPSKLFESQQRYAWQITAHTNDQTIASSPVYNCFGPPLIEAFYAGNHTVFVSSTTSSNVNDLTGEGEVQIDYSGTTQKVYFEHIKIESVGALLVMKKGVVKAKYASKNINLKAEYAPNGKAFFEVDSIMIDTDFMRLKGTVKWSFPHVTIDPSAPVVYSKPTWLTFEDYVLNGIAKLKAKQFYQLADPYGFTVSLDSTSYFIVRGNNNYALHLDGKVTVPKSVKSPTGGEVILPFKASDKVDFINQTSDQESSSIELLDGTNVNLYPSSYAIDFSDSQSPGKLNEQPDWKGIYLYGSIIEFPVSPDKSNQLFLKSVVRYALRDSLGTSDSCWITTQGLQFKVTKAAERPDTLWFNTFPGVFDRYSLAIRNGSLTKGYLKGKIAIPLLSEKDRFSFTVPLSSKGFTTGYLDQSLDGLAIIFNPEGGEQKINLTINRAVFADKERLDMNVDLSWPLMEINMKSLEGLKVWGNGNIGFITQNGTTSLTKQMQTRVKGYEVTIDYIGCGRQQNLYAIGTSADIVMAEDVTGPNGAPKVNIFSIAKNSLLSGSFQSTALPDIYQNVIIQSGGKSKFGTDQTVGVKNSEENQLNDSIANPVNGKEVNVQALALISDLGNGGDTTIVSTELFPSDITAQEELYNYPEGEINVARVIQLIDKVMPFLKNEQRARAEAFKAKLTEYDQSEIVTIYHELRDFDKFLKELAKQTLQTLIAKLNKPILEQSAKVKTKVVGFVNGKRDELLVAIDKKIVLLIDSIGTNAARSVSNDDKSVLSDIILTATEGAREAIPEELNRSVSLSIQRNITDKIIGILDTAITYRITGFIDSTLSRMGYAIIDLNGNFQLDKIGNDAKNLLPDMGEDVFKRVTSFNIGLTIQNTIVDAYRGIRWDELGDEIGKQILFALAERTAVKKAQELASKAVNKVLGENGGKVVGEVAGALMQNVKLDFSNIGDKLKNGQIDKIIKFDPSYIKVPTPVAVFEGWVKFTDDDPTWGDSWQATVTAKIKVGAEFIASAKYVNGSVASKKNGTAEASAGTFKYWFLQIGVNNLNIPLSPTPFTLDGANGKVFHHMVRVSKGVYMPADSVRFGAGLQLFLFDTPSSGAIVAFDVNAEVTVLDGGFIFEMFGNAGIGNAKIQVSANIGNGENSEKTVNVFSGALVSASGYLGFNSIEKHFVGNFTVTFNTSPILCAGGELNVDVKPGSWSISVGTREKPIFVDVFCTKHPQFKGWFAANNRQLDIGLMVNIHVLAESPWIGIPGFKVKPWAEFKLDFGTTAIVAFKPFAIEEAHVWLDIYGGIGVKYKTFLGNGNLTIAAVNIGGEVLFRTTPKTYFKGELHGRVTVFNIGVGFSMNAEHEFS